MRFLNTSTLQFEEIPDSELYFDKNQYAILSHRWGHNEDEVLFDDVRLSRDITSKKGFNKVQGFCRLASSRGFRYGWIDTCCINKANLTELSEAINSMYRWYQESKLCIAYLDDVPHKRLMDSIWFDRCWTLQELIAPEVVNFFDRDWNMAGTKIELSADLSLKTKIPEGVLRHSSELSTCSIAQRISWAAHRESTRIEDKAYSLMGLFNIHMPMIYGEGASAFLRLQQNIIQQSKDESIFAWKMEFSGYTRTYSGLFAPSPSAYAGCSEIVQTRGSQGFSVTNGELSIRMMTIPYCMESFLAKLHCTDKASADDNFFILIARTSNQGEYVRLTERQSFRQRSIPILRQSCREERLIRIAVNPMIPPLNHFYGFWLRTLHPRGHTRSQTKILSNSPTCEADYVCQRNSSEGLAGVIHFASLDRHDYSQNSEVRWIKFSFDSNFNPTLWIANYKHSSQLKPIFDQAISSGGNSQMRQEIMQVRGTDKSYVKYFPDKRLDWSRLLCDQGAFFMTVDRDKGLQGHIIGPLNLEISVQLQPCPSQDTVYAPDNVVSEPLLDPMMIWVVDIIDIGGLSLEEQRDRQLKEEDRQEKERDRKKKEMKRSQIKYTFHEAGQVVKYVTAAHRNDLIFLFTIGFRLDILTGLLKFLISYFTCRIFDLDLVVACRKAASMDPVTATGLAASVVTLMQFTWDLFANSRAIYRSADGLPRNKAFIDGITGDLNRLSEGISTDSTENTSQDLKILAKTCTDIAGELCSALRNLKVKGKRTRWACLRAALKDVWSGSEIEDIQNRLDNVRAQLQIRLTADISVQSRKIASMNNDLQLNLSEKVNESEKAVLKTLQMLDLKISRLSLNIPNSCPSVGRECLDGDTQSTRWQKVAAGSVRAGGHDMDREAQLLLQSLFFRTMGVRHAEIPKTHKQTFRWVFEDSASPFCSWLRSDGRIFWISGKAGSGKSTLMKLISDDSKTQELLRQWSGSKKLVLAKHFFWKPGEEMQKSQDGLLRSLLYDILKQCPELIPAVLEVLPHRSFDTWYPHELLDAFASLSRTAPKFVRLCLIIDGLDEYKSPKGHHLEELIEVIRTLSKQTWVKVCVSSRPWNNFQDAFGSDKSCWLKLEDLTCVDIKTYVQDNLDLSLSKDASSCKLVQTIVKKAEGVFLWVYLAVRDLLQGIQDGDRPSDLIRKADSLPPDLEEFLQNILVSIDPAHQEEAEKHFKLAFHGIDDQNNTYHRLPLLIHTFIGEIEDLENFDHFLSSSPWDTGAFENRLESGRRRLVSRCKGLLETSDNGYLNRSDNKLDPYIFPTVHFFHRTVVEFIFNMYTSKFKIFDSGAFICKAYNVMLDIAYQSHDHDVEKGCSLLVNNLIVSAMHAEQRFGQPSKEMIRWIKQADSIVMQRSDYEHFPLIPRPSYPMPKTFFLEECMCKGFVFYVHLTLIEHPQPRQLSLWLLHTLNWYQSKHPLKPEYLMGRMRKLLLDKLGGDVNLICSYCSGSFVRSIWACALTSVRRATILARTSKGWWVSLNNWGPIINMYLPRCSDALDHVVPFDEHPELASLEEENPKEGLTARTILQRYVPKHSLQEIGIESLDGEWEKYNPAQYRNLIFWEEGRPI
ncbi:MAG: hypothetical protein Q9167_002042 [Letrouitia subvulpina]